MCAAPPPLPPPSLSLSHDQDRHGRGDGELFPSEGRANSRLNELVAATAAVGDSALLACTDVLGSALASVGEAPPAEPPSVGGTAADQDQAKGTAAALEGSLEPSDLACLARRCILDCGLILEARHARQSAALAALAAASAVGSVAGGAGKRARGGKSGGAVAGKSAESLAAQLDAVEAALAEAAAAGLAADHPFVSGAEKAASWLRYARTKAQAAELARAKAEAKAEAKAMTNAALRAADQEADASRAAAAAVAECGGGGGSASPGESAFSRESKRPRLEESDLQGNGAQESDGDTGPDDDEPWRDGPPSFPTAPAAMPVVAERPGRGRGVSNLPAWMSAATAAAAAAAASSAGAGAGTVPHRTSEGPVASVVSQGPPVSLCVDHSTALDGASKTYQGLQGEFATSTAAEAPAPSSDSLGARSFSGRRSNLPAWMTSGAAAAAQVAAAGNASDERYPKRPRSSSDPAPLSELASGALAKLATLATGDDKSAAAARIFLARRLCSDGGDSFLRDITEDPVLGPLCL